MCRLKGGFHITVQPSIQRKEKGKKEDAFGIFEYLSTLKEHENA